MNDKYVKEIELRAQNMLPVLGSMVNLIGGTYMTTLNEHENLRFENE